LVFGTGIPHGLADITYIRLRVEFVYLAVVLDAFSRRVIGWVLGKTLEAGLAVAALQMALCERKPQPGLVHHSDRGVQYASQDYTEMLKRHQAQIRAAKEKSFRQCRLRIVHEDAEVRRGIP
jgi:putative transposase